MINRAAFRRVCSGKEKGHAYPRKCFNRDSASFFLWFHKTPSEKPTRVKTMLSVESRNFNDMRVYVQHESTQRVIMGTVSAFTTRDFKIPDNLLFGTTVLRFVAVSICRLWGFSEP